MRKSTVLSLPQDNALSVTMLLCYIICGATTFSITTLSITTLSIKALYIEYYAECH
jgi:hypothetical protein